LDLSGIVEVKRGSGRLAGWVDIQLKLPGDAGRTVAGGGRSSLVYSRMRIAVFRLLVSSTNKIG
jgi:hypothetical protein